MNRPFSNFILLNIILWGLVGCGNESKITKYRAPKEEKKPLQQSQSTLPHNHPPINSSQQNPSSQPTNSHSDFSWTAPEKWTPGKSSSMRIASYNIPLEGATGDFSLIKLGGNAGGLTANINRWRGQINLDSLSEKEIKASMSSIKSELGEILYCELKNKDNPDQAFLGGIYNGENYVIFAKLSAPLAQIDQATEGFKAFCASLKSK